MRESRTYGSVRGARDETRVPTATRGYLLQCVNPVLAPERHDAQIAALRERDNLKKPDQVLARGKR